MPRPVFPKGPGRRAPRKPPVKIRANQFLQRFMTPPGQAAVGGETARRRVKVMFSERAFSSATAVW